MRILSSSAIRKWSFYLTTCCSFLILFSFQNCGKVKFSSPETVDVILQSCGDIKMAPTSGLYPDTSVSFRVVTLGSLTVSALNWDFSKGATSVYTSLINPAVHTFNHANEGAGDYVANATFTLSDGNHCNLQKSFKILSNDLCADPSGISGPNTGFVGEETSPFSIGFEDCFGGSVTWDMNNDGTVEYSVPDTQHPLITDSVTYVYPTAGTYTVKAVVTNSADNSKIILTHQIIIQKKSCINPFTNQVVPDGQSVVFAKPNPLCGSKPCLTTNRTCNNGVFGGDTTYTQNPATCAISPVCPPLYTGVWTANPAPACTTTCGYAGGTTTGTVTCSNNNCNPATKPAAHTRTCPATAACYTGVWTANPAPACTTTCGYAGGTTTGTVTCSNSNCNPATKPAALTRTCPATATCALPINGSCGAANGTSLTSPPTSNLCTKGSPSSVTTTSSTYAWTCAGSNGGTTASCRATRQYFSTSTCGFSLTSGSWSAEAGQPTTAYNSCEWGGWMKPGSSTQADAIFYFGDYYDGKIFRLNNPSNWTISASGCKLNSIADPANSRKTMPNYCIANSRKTYDGVNPLVWYATITLRNNTTNEVITLPITATFKPTLQ